MDKPFYVYVHRRKTDGTIFYVGKGKGRRAWSKSRTNPHWHNIVKKNGLDVEIVSRFNAEVCAFSFEVALIKHIGKENLCNLTDGGDGVSGYKFPDDVIERLRLHRKKLVMSDENKDILRVKWTGENNPNKNGMTLIHRLNLSESHKGKSPSKETRLKMSASRTGINNPAAKKEMRWFAHNDHGLFYTTEYWLRTNFKLDRSYLSLMARGNKECYRGWICLDIT